MELFILRDTLRLVFMACTFNKVQVNIKDCACLYVVETSRRIYVKMNLSWQEWDFFRKNELDYMRV